MGSVFHVERWEQESPANLGTHIRRRINDLPISDRIRILIVEDHQVVADALGALLNQQPDLLVVGSVASVAESAQRTKELAPDVVILDFHLNDGTGADAAIAIRKAESPAGMLFLTRDDSDSVRIAAIETGVSGVLHKSRAAVEVANAIRIVGRGGSLFSAEEIAGLVSRRRDGEKHMPKLTRRETQVLDLIYEGIPNRAIAAKLGISYTTVRTHIHSLVTKLGVHSKLEVIAKTRRSRPD